MKLGSPLDTVWWFRYPALRCININYQPQLVQDFWTINSTVSWCISLCVYVYIYVMYVVNIHVSVYIRMYIMLLVIMIWKYNANTSSGFIVWPSPISFSTFWTPLEKQRPKLVVFLFSFFSRFFGPKRPGIPVQFRTSDASAARWCSGPPKTMVIRMGGSEKGTDFI